jgi:lipid-binding SYLF domain-containing protein
MNRIVSLAVVVLLLSSALLAGNKKITDTREEERLRASGDVLQEILDIPENIPQDLLNKAECVVVIPWTKKFAIGVGGSYGRGAMSCRTGANYTGPWSAPALYALEGANIGFQLGGEETDFVLLVLNPKGVESLLKSKVKLGADAAAAAGPKGRDAAAATDVLMRAEILTYSRARGLFAGVSLEGSTLRQDNSASRKLYGRELRAREIISGKVGVPPAGQTMVAILRQHSPRNLSDPKSLREERASH